MSIPCLSSAFYTWSILPNVLSQSVHILKCCPPHKDNITPTQHCEAKSSLTHKDSGPEPTASRQPCIATPETAHQNLRRQNDK